MPRTSTTITDSERARELGKLGGRPSKLAMPERGPSHVEDVLAGLDEINRRLVTRGFPAMSDWWRREIERWYRTGKRQKVWRVGRRGGKSSDLSRLGVAEAIYGHHDVPLGDIGFVPIISTDRQEAIGRLRTVKAILDALGVDYAPLEGTPNAIQLDDRTVGFRVFTASVSGVSGFTSIFVLCDEVAKWKDADTGANPATVVLQSVRPTMATMPNARIALSSSPMSRFDAHYDAFELGETEHQDVAYAPSWVANPTLTEEKTHELEPDPVAWEREYKAIPSDEMTESMLTGAEIDAVSLRELAVLPPEPGHAYVAAIDPATKRNAWTLVVGTMHEDDTGRQRRTVVLAKQWQGSPSKPLSPRETLREIALELAPYGVEDVWTDQHGGEYLREIAMEEGLTLIVETWAGAEKVQKYTDLVLLVRSGQVDLPKDRVLRQDLLGIRRKFSRTGVTIDLASTPDGRHSDYAPSTAMVLSRPMDGPRRGRPLLGTPEFEEKLRDDRRKAFAEKQHRPNWMPSGDGGDRGRGAGWKR